MTSIAVLLTCFNRKEKTLACLRSFFDCVLPQQIVFDIILVDDGSKDGTSEAVSESFPSVNLIHGDGNLFWAGGMRLAWKNATERKKYDGYLLLNDDVILIGNVLMDLIATHEYCLKNYGQEGIYSAATADSSTGVISYGGRSLRSLAFRHSLDVILPNGHPQDCQAANANILLVMASVVDKIGIFDPNFTHGIADYDYTLTGYEKKIPVLLCAHLGGYCSDDHGKNWLPQNSTFAQRMRYLYSPKGLAYKEYMYYIRKHFAWHQPYYFTMIWLKTLLPKVWDRLK